MSTSPSITASAAATGSPAGAQRLLSLDALRGFDMFWIIGGESIAHAAAKWLQWGWLVWLSNQLDHPLWDGFTFYDLIFPLFLFISGVTMPWSLTNKLATGTPKSTLYWRVARRALLLIFLGLVVNGLLKFDFANQRYPSVLGRIGIAYFFAAIIVLNSSKRGQIIWTLAILIGYFAVMKLVPVPGVGAGVLTQDGNLASYVDTQVLPGRLYRGNHDPEGLFSTIPAIATALLGALTGQWLISLRRGSFTKVMGLVIAGVLALALGKFWNQWMPINKNLWSSSFVLWTAGWSWLFLSLFYLLIDVWGLRRWAFFFVVIGMNPITIYMLRERFLSFDFAAHRLFDGVLKFVPDTARPTCFAISVMVLIWLFLWFLYRKRVFLRV